MGEIIKLKSFPINFSAENAYVLINNLAFVIELYYFLFKLYNFLLVALRYIGDFGHDLA